MTTTTSAVQDRMLQHISLDIGEVYLFDKFIITEFKFGAEINFENFYDVSLLIQEHFKNEPFGIIANRVNSYSVNLNDAPLFNEAFPNCKAFAIVHYNPLTEMVIEVENRFFTFNREAFANLVEAVNWVDQNLVA